MGIVCFMFDGIFLVNTCHYTLYIFEVKLPEIKQYFLSLLERFNILQYFVNFRVKD